MNNLTFQRQHRASFHSQRPSMQYSHNQDDSFAIEEEESMYHIKEENGVEKIMQTKMSVIRINDHERILVPKS